MIKINSTKVKRLSKLIEATGIFERLWEFIKSLFGSSSSESEDKARVLCRLAGGLPIQETDISRILKNISFNESNQDYMERFVGIRNTFLQEKAEQYTPGKLHPWLNYVRNNERNLNYSQKFSWDQFLGFLTIPGLKNIRTSIETSEFFKDAREKAKNEIEELRNMILSSKFDKSETVFKDLNESENILIKQKKNMDREYETTVNNFKELFRSFNKEIDDLFENLISSTESHIKMLMTKVINPQLMDISVNSPLNKILGFIRNNAGIKEINISLLFDTLFYFGFIPSLYHQKTIVSFEILNIKNYEKKMLLVI